MKLFTSPYTVVGVLQALLGFAVVGLAYLCVYRLFFHPYAKYPGPLLAKLTSWYSVYHAYTGDLHIDIWACHQKYGDLVRYAPNRLLVNTDVGLKSIYGFGKNVQKSKAYHRISLVKGAEALQSVVNKPTHGKLRRIISQGFAESFIRASSSEVLDVARILCRRLGEPRDDFAQMPLANTDDDNDGWTCPKNMAVWSDLYTFDVMSRVVFGSSYDMLESSENHWISHAIQGQLRRISYLFQLPELEDLGLHRIMFPDARRRAFRFSQKSKQLMDTRREAGKPRSEADIFSLLVEARDPDTNEALSEQQLWAESNLLIIAGSDTTSTGIAATFFYLSRNPAAYRRVVAEVRSTFRSSGDVKPGPALSSCVYLRACVTEAMRLCPPAAGAMWREVLPGGLLIGDEHIPEGLDVGTGIFALQHDQRYFPQPLKYWPERWLAEHVGQAAVDVANSAYTVFSIGPRNCVGRSLAMLELMVCMATVISDYDFRAAAGHLGRVGEGKGLVEGQYQVKWAFTSDKDGPYIQFKKACRDGDVPEKAGGGL
ncbi:hypothetical protein QIS74_06983 [Colletotrichum tabaci]|uniref:Uncharacterized protein n=1 Tax=Colletotrichum tabaci TaxID=1209068 RepID=A0AAV9TDV2_9PEZI